MHKNAPSRIYKNLATTPSSKPFSLVPVLNGPNQHFTCSCTFCNFINQLPLKVTSFRQLDMKDRVQWNLVREIVSTQIIALVNVSPQDNTCVLLWNLLEKPCLLCHLELSHEKTWSFSRVELLHEFCCLGARMLLVDSWGRHWASYHLTHITWIRTNCWTRLNAKPNSSTYFSKPFQWAYKN